MKNTANNIPLNGPYIPPNQPLQQADLQIFYIFQNQTFGPVSPVQLQNMITNGQLPPKTMVWYNGLPAWLPASKLFGNLKKNSNLPLTEKELAQSRTSMILGYIGLGAWLIPLLGIGTAIAGIILGSKGRNKKGIIFNSVVLTASIVILIASIAAKSSSSGSDNNYNNSRNHRTEYLVKKYSHILSEEQIRALRGEGDSSSATSAIIWLTDRNLGHIAEDIVRD